MSTYTGSITLASSTGDYGIKLSHEKIYKFVSDGAVVDLTPNVISIKCFSKKSGARTDLRCSQYSLRIYVNNDSSELITDILTGLEGRIRSEGEDSWEPILSNIIVASTTYYELNLGYLLYCELKEVQEGAQFYERYQKLLALRALIVSENIPILIEAYNQNSFLAAQTFPVEFGTSENMAKFAVTATSIQAAVNNSKLSFNENEGLVIQNGGFKIINIYEESGEDQEELLFGYDETSNSLFIKGSGEFTGEITAPSGSIGGFRIIEGVLYSEAGVTEGESGPNYEEALIKLNGLTGEVYSRTITLGEGVTIEKYLALGDYAKIFNPQNEDSGGDVLRIIANDESTVFSLNQNGVLQLGSITLDGNQSRISGNSFDITPGKASFTNIEASGKLSAVTFEVNKVQAVGGAMMFRPSYKIENVINRDDNAHIYTFALDETFKESLGQDINFVYLLEEDAGSSTGQKHVLGLLTQVSDNQVTVQTSETLVGDNNITSLIFMGKDGSIVIGINSNESNSTSLIGQGLTISEFKVRQSGNFYTVDSDSSQIKAFLGNLLNTGINNIGGFGLYSDNAFLNGSLVTRIEGQSASYAGIDTLKEVQKNGSRVVFWAGASSASDTDIVDAPFIVTRDGSIYAYKGEFSGTVRGATIQGADIYAARIHANNTQEPGLAFYNQSKGIAFYKGTYNSSPSEIFAIGNGGFTHTGNSFISFDSSSVNFIGNKFETTLTNGSSLWMQGSRMDFGNSSGQSVGYLAYSDGLVSLRTGYNGINGMGITENEVTLNAPTVSVNNIFAMGENKKFQYRPVGVMSAATSEAGSGEEFLGYNLYVL